MSINSQIRFCTFTEPTADRFKGVTHNASAGDYNDDTQGYTMVYPIPYAVLNLNKKTRSESWLYQVRGSSNEETFLIGAYQGEW